MRTRILALVFAAALAVGGSALAKGTNKGNRPKVKMPPACDQKCATKMESCMRPCQKDPQGCAAKCMPSFEACQAGCGGGKKHDHD